MHYANNFLIAAQRISNKMAVLSARDIFFTEQITETYK